MMVTHHGSKILGQPSRRPKYGQFDRKTDPSVVESDTSV